MTPEEMTYKVTRYKPNTAVLGVKSFDDTLELESNKTRPRIDAIKIISKKSGILNKDLSYECTP